MKEICGRALIILLSAILYFQYYSIDMVHVAILLIGIGIGFIQDIALVLKSFTSNSKCSVIIFEILMSLIAVCCLIFPPLVFCIPGWAMCAKALKLKYCYLAGAVPVLISLVTMGNPLPVFVVILAAIGFLFESIVLNSEEYSTSLRKERDYAREYEIVLQEKNRMLTENQDNEIYTATLQERNRIAREIHDNVGHMLTRSIMQIGAIKVINNDEKLSPMLNDLHETLDTAMSNIRTSVHDLHDEAIDLCSAIMDLKDSLPGIEVNVVYDMKSIIPKEIKYAFIAIVKEATNNTLKHSNATAIDIVIQEQPGFFQLTVSDNGTDASVDVGSGMGLSTMQERVKNINGTMRIFTDKGFSILVTVIK